MPPGGLSWGAFVSVACVTQGPLGHAWLGHPGAPGHVCRGQPWGPSSRSVALGGLAAAAGGATASLSPPPCHSSLQRRAGSRAAPRSRPHQTHPLRPCPPLTVTHGCARAAPPSTPIPWTPAAIHRPQPPEPADPDPLAARPPLRRSVRGGAGGRGGRPRPLHFFQECADPHAPASRSDFPRLPHDTRTAHALFA